MNEENNELAKLLIDAADEKPGAAEAFYELLLRSEVFIPTQGANGNKVSELGTSHIDELGFVTVDYEGQECLPIFSQESFLTQWAEREMTFTKKSFSSLLWLIGDSTWLYLDANQQAGKEITSWEIELLKKGKDAIPELVAASYDNPLLELEVETNSELFLDLKRKLIPVLELSSKLDEAFIVGIKDGENLKPMLGLKYNKAAAAERKYIREELQQVSEEVVIVDDVGSGSNDNFFTEATPFYIRQKNLPGSQQKKSFIKKVTNIFKK